MVTCICGRVNTPAILYNHMHAHSPYYPAKTLQVRATAVASSTAVLRCRAAVDIIHCSITTCPSCGALLASAAVMVSCAWRHEQQAWKRPIAAAAEQAHQLLTACDSTKFTTYIHRCPVPCVASVLAYTSYFKLMHALRTNIGGMQLLCCHSTEHFWAIIHAPASPLLSGAWQCVRVASPLCR
jgi:hypothetical protein